MGKPYGSGKIYVDVILLAALTFMTLFMIGIYGRVL
jgi:hypothetical protein